MSSLTMLGTQGMTDNHPTPPVACEVCRSITKRVWTCVQCGHFSFCDNCWDKQLPHRPGARGYDNLPHEKVDMAVVERLKRIFGEGRSQEHQNSLFDIDTDTMWFGVNRDGSHAFLDCSDRLLDIMLESNNDLSVSDRFPQLVSFVGKTGEGKSTIIQMLISKEQARIRAESTLFPAPVNGLLGDVHSTSGDVHLYADPATHQDARPILFADCEGLSGGESAPRAKEHRAGHRSTRKKLQKRLQLGWALDPTTSSRGYAEARRFESDVLVHLVEWAFSSIEMSINQPVLPHLIIALNKTDNDINDQQWDCEFATDHLLNAFTDITRVPELIDIIRRLNDRGRNVRSAKDLLQYFYRTITVIRIPTKGRYMLIDDQIGKLYEQIRDKSNSSHIDKKAVRMALNAERMHQFMSAAYDHFSRNLNRPFDFIREALLLNPVPHDFEGYLLHFMRVVCNQLTMCSERERLDRAKSLVASCITLMITRKSLTGKTDDLLERTFRTPLKGAFEELCEKWLPCGFRIGGKTCINVRFAHVKGHQVPDGRLLKRGLFQPRLDESEDFEGWFQGIGQELKRMINKLPDREGEKESAWRLHLDRVERFYRRYPGVSRDVNHTACFCCLNSVPEHVLPCGHVLCTECVRALGSKLGRGLLTIGYCPFNRHEHNWESNPVPIRFKPDGAGVRALCLDGGGVRGVVELVMLEELEKQLEGIPVQDFFDLIVGTSTGGIIALALGVKNMSVRESLCQFKALCQQAFTSRILRRLVSRYKTKFLREQLQDIFGTSTPLFGSISSSPSSNIKVAVTTSLNVGKSTEPILLTNYDVAQSERRELKVKYKALLRSIDPRTDIKIWEAALATSAAPPYFKPYVQPETGKVFVDGAVHYNCPAWVVHHERKLLWKDVQHQPLDILLSLGTGFGTDGVASDVNNFSPTGSGRGFALSNMINIVRGIVESQLNSEQSWNNYYAATTRSNYPEDQLRYIRLNVKFKGKVPRLDQLSKLAPLESVARFSAREDPGIKEAADRLVASSFYFERARRRSSTGFIYCRFDPGTSNSKLMGALLVKRIEGDFEPHFMLQADYDTQREVYLSSQEITVPRRTWEEMKISGKFEVAVSIPAACTDIVRLSLRLRASPSQHHGKLANDPYVSISGFPRRLLDDSSKFSLRAHSADTGARPDSSRTSVDDASPLAAAGEGLDVSGPSSPVSFLPLAASEESLAASATTEANPGSRTPRNLVRRGSKILRRSPSIAGGQRW